ncbi:unnamed protein product [Acanthoscelides obtectus]|uniref:Uncharacterized protein n=1 Tax=Acanthoscelides obtectus TaxID=200917 RepID=A0A9P0LGZ3_ACAOB|nr:unnamed protein product [Acanthoscelides obtectus]CAK1658894.1 hypothetical protein AOBTE_LOCUS21186 [Acanthoscelides obtectus]
MCQSHRLNSKGGAYLKNENNNRVLRMNVRLPLGHIDDIIVLEINVILKLRM